MAIKILGEGLPVVGYLKIGEASAKGSRLKGAPYKFDHVEVTGRQRDSEDRLVLDLAVTRRILEAGAKTCGGCERSRELAKRFDAPELEGGLPIQVPILLPYDDLELDLPSRLAYYKARTAYCVGDGESAFRLVTIGEKTVDGKKVEVYGAPTQFGPCGPTCPDFISRRCKPHAKLRCILAIQASVGGCYEFATTSWNSLRNLTGSLEMIRAITRGTLAWIPLVFDLSPQTVQPKDGGRASKAYVARVTFPGTPKDLLASVRDTLALQAPILGKIRELEATLRGESQWKETPGELEAHQAEYLSGDLEREGAPVGLEPDDPEVAGLVGEPPADDDDVPDPERPEAAPDPTGDATPEDFARLGAATLARADELFDSACEREGLCVFADAKVLDQAIKAALLDGFGLRGATIPKAAIGPMLAFVQACELDEDGKLATPADVEAF